MKIWFNLMYKMVKCIACKAGSPPEAYRVGLTLYCVSYFEESLFSSFEQRGTDITVSFILSRRIFGRRKPIRRR